MNCHPERRRPAFGRRNRKPALSEAEGDLRFVRSGFDVGEPQILRRAEPSQQAQKRRLPGALVSPPQDDNSVVLASTARLKACSIPGH
jgi:hypothetical protein